MCSALTTDITYGALDDTGRRKASRLHRNHWPLASDYARLGLECLKLRKRGVCLSLCEADLIGLKVVMKVRRIDA